MNKHEYRGFYKNYNMDGLISVGTGMVKVHSVFESIPKFMLEADCVFVDPPCSNANINSFYTKAGIDSRKEISAFNRALKSWLVGISPKNIFMEVFNSNKDFWENELSSMFENVFCTQSYYYGDVNKKCWILQGTNNAANFNIPHIDEEKVIERICKWFDFKCIADPCMGKGLVGFYANKNGRRFVGTELNKKRLACLIEHVNQDKIIVR